MEHLVRLITMQDANTRVVLIGVTMLGVVCGVVGTFAVLRRRALMADAVAHAALPGVCLAFLLAGTRSMPVLLGGALAIGVVAAAFVALVKRASRVKEDAAIAIAIGGFFGLGIVLSRVIQNQPSGNRAGLDGFIFGKAASMVGSDALTIAVVAGVALLGVALLYKELKLLCFDEPFARGIGRATGMLDFALMGLVCACVVAGLPAVGVVLMVALLVIAPAAARFWTDRLGVMTLLAALCGGVSAFVGTALSAVVAPPEGSLSRGWPTGPVIVLVGAAVFVASMLAAPKRGVLAEALRRVRMRRRMALQHLLRDAYERLESTGDFAGVWRTEHLARVPHAGAMRRAVARRLVAPRGQECSFTSAGLQSARGVVRAHRLWEMYLIEQAQIAPDHVDRDADDIEHVLSPEVIEQLETRLREQGRLPLMSDRDVAVPASPHPIQGPRGVARSVLWLPLAMAGTLLASLPAQDAAAGVIDVRSVAATLSETPARMSIDGAESGLSNPAWFRIGSYAVTSIDMWTLATASCCSVACAVLGCFLVLRRMSLLGDAISHAILPGIAAAFLISGSRDPLVMLLGAACAGLITAGLTSALSRWGRVQEDAATGVVFTTLFALGVILISIAARSVDLDPGCVLYGLLELAPFDTSHVWGVEMPRAFVWLSVALIINVALIAVFFKELRIACFDPFLATSMGINAALVQAGLLGAVAATSVAAFDAVGSILVIAMLVGPGATAQLLTDRLLAMLVWSAGIAALSSVTGYALAVYFNTSIAGMIATVMLTVFFLALLLAPAHGVLGRRVQARALADSDAQ